MYAKKDILRRLKSSNPENRRVAVVMIGKARLHEMVGSLTTALKFDSDKEVRAMAAWSLDMLGSVEAIPTLVKALYDDAFGVRSNAGWALVHLAERMVPQLVIPDVIDVLRDHSSSDARQMAYLVLSHIDDDMARQAIKRYWES